MNTYWIGVFVSLTAVGAWWFAALLSTLYAHVSAFVNDENLMKWPKFLLDDGCYYDGADAFAQLSLGGVGLVLIAFAWPVASVIFVIVVALRLIRRAVRFKKVYEKHTHDGQTGAIR